MFELSQFYDYCRQNRVDVIPYRGIPQPGATIRDGGQYAVFLDFSQIMSTRLLRGICAHEVGHAATGALHKVSSPYDLIAKHEYKADKWAIEQLVPARELDAAVAHGCTDLYSLAEHFDVTVPLMEKAVSLHTHGNLSTRLSF